MIGRRTTRLLAEIMEITFHRYHSGSGRSSYYTVDTTQLYDFLFDNGYPAWFCNDAKRTYSSVGTRQLKEFIMKLHTGETQYEATPKWSWEQREKLGQQYLSDLCEDLLNLYTRTPPTGYGSERLAATIQALRESLELDGHSYKDSRLLSPEADVLDTNEETGTLHSLFKTLSLGDEETAFHHLNLSEEHYLAHRWDDSISNSRKFLEAILQQVALSYSTRIKQEPLQEAVLSRPAQVRDYLAKEGLLESKEKEAVASVYGLLSETGSHPYMAQNDQARLLRHLALTFSQFVMLRFKGRLESA